MLQIWKGFVAAATLLASCCAMAQRESFPDRPISIVVPFVAGSSLDAFTRMVAQRLVTRVHQPVVILNRAGAGGTVGAEFVARSAPDGYTLLASTNGLAIAASAYTKLRFNPARDFEPISHLSSSPHVLLTPTTLKADSINELVSLAKSEPGKLNFAGGLGNSDHLTGELFKSLAGVDIVHIAYGGGPPALMDTISGRVQMYFSGLPAALPLLAAGKVKALGVSSKARTPLLPNVPAIAESLPNFEVDLWYGLFAPAGTPREIVDKLSEAVQATMKDPEVREQALKMGVEPVGSSAAQFRSFYAANLDQWSRVVKNIRLVLD